jgi:hypothetical protein
MGVGDFNPAIRFDSMSFDFYPVPDGAGRVYETEANIIACTTTGDGDGVNIPSSISEAVSAWGGTGLLVLSGGSLGVLAVETVYIYFEIYSPFGDSSGAVYISGFPVSGWWRRTGGQQEIEVNATGLNYWTDEPEYRATSLRLLRLRAMP